MGKFNSKVEQIESQTASWNGLSRVHCTSLCTVFLHGSKVLPACPSDSSSIRMKVSMEHWWNDNGREKPKYWERNLSQCQFVHHKPHVVWPRAETGPPL